MDQSINLNTSFEHVLSFLTDIVTRAALEIRQFADQLRRRLYSQQFKGISRVIQNY